MLGSLTSPVNGDAFMSAAVISGSDDMNVPTAGGKSTAEVGKQLCGRGERRPVHAVHKDDAPPTHFFPDEPGLFPRTRIFRNGPKAGSTEMRRLHRGCPLSECIDRENGIAAG